MKKIKMLFLTIAMVITMLSGFTPIQAATNDNIALGKTATASTVFPGKPWTADKAIDGIVDDTTTKESRWSSLRIGTGTPASEYTSDSEQWLLIDLGQQYPVSQINIFWEGAFATKYKLQYSDDGTTFTDILSDAASGAGWKKHKGFNTISAQYIRVLCQTPKTAKYGYSIFEVEVYQQKEMESASDIINLVENIAPTIASDGKSIILPSVPEGYDISLFGTDNQQVINKSGQIIQPLVDMDVNVMYKVEKKGDSKNTATSTKDAKISIKGKYNQETGDNEKPNVVPGLREWKGAQGQFTLTNSSRIVYDNDSQKAAATMIQSYFKSMLNKQIEIAKATAKKGDIYLKAGSTTEELGKEGYYLDIGDFVTITSPTYTGFIYGGASITQILYQDEGWDNAPKGLARDYPQYEVRAGMIDVGRMFVPLNYLEEMTIYMSWYKMNEAHIHINDYWGPSGYSAFRLESKVYPSINAKDGYYTQEEYKKYQKDMEKYSIDVITEIDTPYHAEAFKDIPGVQMLSGKPGYLDITTDSAFEANKKIIENLFDEYLDGEDPIIQSKNFHIGTDEYDKKYGEQMRKWTDHFIKYVNSKGYESRAWASLGKNGFNGVTPVTNDAVMNLWAPYWADVKETYDAGYDVINTYGGWLYIVPAANAGYPDRFDTKKLYEKFEVNDFKSGRNTLGEAIMPVAHPQTKGASFAIWNDMTSFKTGFSWFDIQDRMKDAVSLVAEKTWFGEDEAGQTYEQFRTRIDALQNKAANTNPGRYVESKTSKIADYEFKTATNTVKDLTDNHYDAKVTNGKVVNEELVFNGNGYMSLPMQSVGYPYTVSMDIKLTDINEQTILFNGEDGTFYANLDGKLGYKRGDYGYTFDYELKVNKQVNLTLVCGNKNLVLYVNGKKIGNGKLTNTTIGGKAQESSTFVLPVEKVFENTKGSISSLAIYNYEMSDDEIKDMNKFVPRQNIALNKTATASALEVSDGRWTADKAVDGIISTESRVSFAKADEQWLLVDLGKVESVGGVSINYESAVGKYEIQVSTDGVNFEPVYTKNGDSIVGKTATTENIEFTPVQARYVKYVQKEMWKHTNNQWYSGSIYEFNIYKSMKVELLESVSEVEKELDKYTVGVKNGQLDKSYHDSLVTLLNSYKSLANDSNLTQDDLESAKTKLDKELKDIPTHILYIKQEAIDAYNELKSLDYHLYTSESYQLMKNKFKAIEEAINNISDYKDVNACIKMVNDAKVLLVKVDSKKLKGLIDEINKIDLTQYVNTTVLENTLKDAKDVYEKPVSQKAIDDMYNKLLKAYKALEKKPTTPEKPIIIPGYVANEDNSVIVSGQLPKDIKLSSKELNKEEIKEIQQKIHKADSRFLKTAMLEKVYDLELLLKGSKYNVDGSLTVTLKLEESMKNKNLGIVYIDDEGKITKIDSIIDNGYIQFKTTHFSTYAIVSYESNKEEGIGKPGQIEIPNTSDNANIVLVVGMMVITGAIYLVMRKKKEEK